MSGYRLASGGTVDRDRTVSFTFDGRRFAGHAGDTLASALLANGRRLFGRSFKLHRPRGVFTAGFEEPCALVELRTGARREPNTPATVVELFDGLEAASQNRWPSLSFDVMAVNGLAGRFLPAGFYYKTFMWPAALWEKLYEPAIRRAAGLGRAADAPDPDHYETMHAHCDVLVVGSGAAGLAAARTAAEAGLRVILCEQDRGLGGGLLVETDHAAWRADMVAALGTRPDVTILTRTAVAGAYEHGVFAAVERVADHLPAPPHGIRQRLWVIRARRTILASGAIERLVAFAGNDRPGVMLAGAVEAYAARFGVACGRRVVVFAAHDAAYDAALRLSRAGVGIGAIVDPRADTPAAGRARLAGIEVLSGHEVCGTEGGHGLHGVLVRPRGGSGGTYLSADVLAVSGGYTPSVALASQAQVPLRYDPAIAAYVPDGEGGRLVAAGAARGVFGIAEAARDGAAQARALVEALGGPASAPFDMPEPDTAARGAFLPVFEVEAKGKAFVDLQHDVTADDMRLAHREGYTHVEHAKRYTTHTMATDQGKTGGIVGAAILAEARGESLAEVGVPRMRPYAVPASWGALAGPDTGAHFKPIRRMPLHDWHEAHGAVFVNTGIWKRPLVYSPERDTSWEPVLREARAVRSGVGICDVSTLGKIDVQGRDAAAFLDRIYANTFSTLQLGRARYGLMLREDGILFDDGTTSRLAPEHFLVTTTSMKQAEALEHMEWHAATVWPELDVAFAAVTDRFAQFAVAGPKARAVLAAAIEGLDVSNEALPFMAHAPGRAAGVPVHVYRISFSGELGYEVAVPARHALTVWQALLEAGRPHGITPYGLDALNVLRVEKGHVTGAEINGTTTADDLGLGKMLKKTGDFVGRTLARRAALVAPAERRQLVGLRPVVPGTRLRGGAHVTAASDESLGYVTSAVRSVVFDGDWFALAIVLDGRARIGTRLRQRYPLLDEDVEVEIVSAHAYDPENARVRA